MVSTARSSILFVSILLLTCGGAVAQPLPNISYDKGARSHPFDLLHLKLDVDLYFDSAEVTGSVTHTFRWLNPGYATLHLDAAAEIRVGSVTENGRQLAFSRDSTGLDITLAGNPAYGDTLAVTINYSVHPTSGIWFVKKNPDEVYGRDQIWTQGEGEEHHHWIPMYDYPNDLATTEVLATVRGDWKLLSNGELVSVTPVGDRKRWHYRMTEPHASYLLMIAAGDYLVTRDTVDGIPLEFWTYPEYPERVDPTFRSTPSIVRFFNRRLTVPYPWNKYAQVMINEFMYGGMENTTATTLNDFALIDEKGRIEYQPEGLIAHEFAHQWFGDLITNRSWDHLWLHESFATYMAARAMLADKGRDDYENAMRGYRHGALATDRYDGPSPIAGGNGNTANNYGRGAYVLHMLNSIMGEELFWRSINYFLRENAHGVVETRDLVNAFADVTGANLDWFFDSWVYGAGSPVVDVERSDIGDSVKLTFRQHAADSSGTLFRFPLKVAVCSGNAALRKRDAYTVSEAWVTDSVASLTVPRGTGPDNVIVIDPGEDLLGTIHFDESLSELVTQARLAPNAVDRLDAIDGVRHVIDETDSTARRDSIGKVGNNLSRAYFSEPVDFVRSGLIALAADLDFAAADTVVIAGLSDPEHQVRSVATRNAWVLDDERLELELRPMLDDPSTEIAATALRLLAKSGAEGLRPALLRMRYIRGTRESTAREWMDAVVAGSFDDQRDRVAYYAMHGNRWRTRATGLSTLAALGTVDSLVVEALKVGLADDRGQVVEAALKMCENLNDPQLNNILRTTKVDANDELRDKIDEALKKIENDDE